MKAVILASGLGKRLLPLTQDKPKGLVQIGGKELIARILDAVIEQGITNIVFTTGHEAQKLREFVGAHYPSLHVTYVHSPLFATTNYIYSWWLARDAILGDDILLFHSDMLFESDLLSRLMAQKGSAVLVSAAGPSKKDFNARIENGFVKEIGTKITGPNLRFLAPLYKLEKDDVALWTNAIDQFVQQGKTTNYVEDAFNAMSPQFELRPVYFEENELCMEVDDFDDLKKANEYLEHIRR